MSIMGKSSADDVMRNFGHPLRWGSRVQLAFATFNCKAQRERSTLCVIVDGIHFRFAAENWIYPNQAAYDRNQRHGALWIMYDEVEKNRDLSSNQRRWLDRFIGELNDYFSGNHTRLQIDFVFGQRQAPRLWSFTQGDHIQPYYTQPDYEWMRLSLVVPHTPQPERGTYAPRSL